MSGSSDDAETPLRHVLSLDPYDVEATYHLVARLIDQDRLSEAVALLRPVVEHGPPRVSELAYPAFELANRRVNEAVPLLQRIVAHVPGDIVARCRLGEALVAFGQPAAAAGHFQRAADGPATGTDQWLFKAIALSRLQRSPEAEDALRHALALDPYHHETTYHLARLLIDQDRLSEAVALLSPIVAGGSPRLSELGSLVFELASRRVREAVPLLQRIVAHVPGDIVATCRLGDVLAALGEPAAAAIHFQRAADGQATGADQWLYRAIALSRLQRSGEAEAALRHVLALDPYHVEATYHLARCLIDQERLSDAVALLRPIVEGGSLRVSELASLLSHLASRRVGEAVPLLQRIVERVPGDIVVACQLGEALRVFGEPAAAAVHFERAADGRPRSPDQWLFHAIALIRLQRSAEAEAPLRHVLTLDPYHVEATFHLVELLIDQDRPSDAVALLRPIVEQGSPRLTELGYLAFQLASHRVTAAVPLLQRIAEHVPGDIVAHCQLGEALVAFNQRAAAAVHFERAAEGQPTGPDQRVYKAIALTRLQRSSEAEELVRDALTLDPYHVGAASHLVRLLIDRHRLADALTTLAASVERLREHSAPLVPLAMELLIRGVPEAEAVLHDIVALNSQDAKLLRAFTEAAYWSGLADVALDCVARSRALGDSVSLRIDDDLMLPLVLSSEDEIERRVDRFRAGVAALTMSGARIANPLQPVARPPYYQLFCFGLDTRELYTAAATLWQTVYPDLVWTAPHCETWRDEPLRRRLRVGFLTQPAFPLVWGIARELDRTRFEVVHLHQESDPLTPDAPWHGAADRHVAIPDRDVKEAQRVVADEALDVLVHMPFTPLRYFLSHARLAPVQCVLCEPCYTDGLATLDYYISWAPAEPTPISQWYTCAVALMNRPPYWVERDYTKPAVLQRTDFELPQGARWYLYPGTPPKMHPRFDGLLARILAEDPEGLLILLRGDWPAARIVERRIRRAAGPAADRVHLLPTLPAHRAHALLALADAVLDGWPLGGMSSAFAALHGGIPTVTLPANIPFGRWLASMYETIGVTDLVAADEADFVRLAIRLAKDPRWRDEIAARIRARSATLIEDRLAVREVETFLTAAVAAAHRGERPRPWKDSAFGPRP
jgi:Flp pilus assembly protein TadD